MENFQLTNWLCGARTHRFITVFTGARHRALSWATWTHSTLPQAISLRSTLISIFRCLGHARDSVHFRGGCKYFATLKFIIVFWDVLPCKMMWWWRQHVPLKRRSTTNLHGSISQKTILNIILAAVRTWNLIKDPSFNYLKLRSTFTHKFKYIVMYKELFFVVERLLSNCRQILIKLANINSRSNPFHGCQGHLIDETKLKFEFLLLRCERT
jgi:hypothetical protein